MILLMACAYDLPYKPRRIFSFETGGPLRQLIELFFSDSVDSFWKLNALSAMKKYWEINEIITFIIVSGLIFHISINEPVTDDDFHILSSIFYRKLNVIECKDDTFYYNFTVRFLVFDNKINLKKFTEKIININPIKFFKRFANQLDWCRYNGKRFDLEEEYFLVYFASRMYHLPGVYKDVLEEKAKSFLDEVPETRLKEIVNWFLIPIFGEEVISILKELGYNE